MLFEQEYNPLNLDEGAYTNMGNLYESGGVIYTKHFGLDSFPDIPEARTVAAEIFFKYGGSKVTEDKAFQHLQTLVDIVSDDSPDGDERVAEIDEALRAHTECDFHIQITLENNTLRIGMWFGDGKEKDDMSLVVPDSYAQMARVALDKAGYSVPSNRFALINQMETLCEKDAEFRASVDALIGPVQQLKNDLAACIEAASEGNWEEADMFKANIEKQYPLPVPEEVEPLSM